MFDFVGVQENKIENETRNLSQVLNKQIQIYLQKPNCFSRLISTLDNKSNFLSYLCVRIDRKIQFPIFLVYNTVEAT